MDTNKPNGLSNDPSQLIGNAEPTPSRGLKRLAVGAITAAALVAGTGAAFADGGHSGDSDEQASTEYTAPVNSEQDHKHGDDDGKDDEDKNTTPTTQYNAPATTQYSPNTSAYTPSSEAEHEDEGDDDENHNSTAPAYTTPTSEYQDEDENEHEGDDDHDGKDDDKGDHDGKDDDHEDSVPYYPSSSVPKYDTTTSTYPPVTVVVPTTEAPSTSVEVIEPPVPSTTAAPTTTITELGIDTVHTTTTVGPVVKEGTPLPRTGEDMGDGLEVGGLLVAGGSVAAAIARRKK